MSSSVLRLFSQTLARNEGCEAASSILTRVIPSAGSSKSSQASSTARRTRSKAGRRGSCRATAAPRTGS